MEIPEVTPMELKAELDAGQKPFLLDVREGFELEISKLNVDAHIPMESVPARLEELNRDDDIVVICRSGARSARVAAYLLQNGFSRVRNLASGMNGWAATVDPSLPQY